MIKTLRVTKRAETLAVHGDGLSNQNLAELDGSVSAKRVDGTGAAGPPAIKPHMTPPWAPREAAGSGLGYGARTVLVGLTPGGRCWEGPGVPGRGPRGPLGTLTAFLLWLV